MHQENPKDSRIVNDDNGQRTIAHFSLLGTRSENLYGPDLPIYNIDSVNRLRKAGNSIFVPEYFRLRMFRREQQVAGPFGRRGYVGSSGGIFAMDLRDFFRSSRALNYRRTWAEDFSFCSL